MISFNENTIDNKVHSDILKLELITKILSTTIDKLKSPNAPKEEISLFARELRESLPNTLTLLSPYLMDVDKRDLISLSNQLKDLCEQLVLGTQQSILELDRCIALIKIIVRNPHEKIEKPKSTTQPKVGNPLFAGFFGVSKDMVNEVTKYLPAKEYAKFTSANKYMQSIVTNESWEELFKKDFEIYYALIKKCNMVLDYQFAYRFAIKLPNREADYFLTKLFVITNDVLNYAKLLKSTNHSDFKSLRTLTQVLSHKSQRMLDYLFWLNYDESPEKQFENAILYNQLKVLQNIPDEVKSHHINLLRLSDEQIPALHYAALSGKTDLALELLKIPGIDVNLLDSHFFSALYLSAQNNNREMMGLLLRHNANINAPIGHHNCATILHLALSGKVLSFSGMKIDIQPIDKDLIPFLLAHGAGFEVQNNTGLTPIELMRILLPYKEYKIFIGITKVLLKELNETMLRAEIFDKLMTSELSDKVNYDFVTQFPSDMYSCKLLMAAVYVGDIEILEWLSKRLPLLEQDFPTDKEQRNNFLNKLITGALSQPVRILETLIRSSIIPKDLINSKSSQRFRNVLDLDFVDCNYGTVKFLLECGADPNEAESLHKQLLFNNKITDLNLLLVYGADPAVKGKGIIEFAEEHKKHDIVLRFKSYPALINILKKSPEKTLATKICNLFKFVSMNNACFEEYNTEFRELRIFLENNPDANREEILSRLNKSTYTLNSLDQSVNSNIKGFFLFLYEIVLNPEFAAVLNIEPPINSPDLNNNNSRLNLN